MKNKTAIIIILIGIFVGVYFLVSSNLKKAEVIPELKNLKAVVYKSPNCGCCDVYVSYLRRNGLEAEKINIDDIREIKNKYEIPNNVLSCHTTVLGDYVVEGHVPLEVINELFSKKPDIKGIGMAGMPSGSPGMPGPKMSSFNIYSLNNDGSTSLFAKY